MQHTAEWLSRQLGEMRHRLADSEDRLHAYLRQSGLLFTGDKQSPSEEKLRQIQDALSKAQDDRMTKQALMETSLKASPEALVEMVKEPSLREYQTKLTDLRRQRADLASVFKPNFDLVKRLDAQIATVVAALEKQRTAILEQIRNDYESASRREELLRNSYTAQTDRVTKDGEKTVQYGILKREVDSNSQLYELMLRRVNETSVTSALRASNVRIVDPAKPPHEPYEPSLFRNLFWGLVAGLVVGTGCTVVSRRSDRHIRNPGELGFYLSVPELGVIPSANGLLAGKERYVGGAEVVLRRGEVFANNPPVVGSAGRVRPGAMCRLVTSPSRPTLETPTEVLSDGRRVELVSWQQRSSKMAESFRAILTSILLANVDGKAPTVMVVTSALPGEGKTTVASNLALTLARIGKRVLLIDADLNKPSIGEVFGVPQEYGLLDLLASTTTDFGDLLADAIQVTSIPRVFVLTGGSAHADATRLLYSETMADLLRQARIEFDMVLIDTAAMLEAPDARILGRMAEGVALVVRAGMTTRDVALTVKERLEEDGIVLLGTVLNDWVAN